MQRSRGLVIGPINKDALTDGDVTKSDGISSGGGFEGGFFDIVKGICDVLLKTHRAMRKVGGDFVTVGIRVIKFAELTSVKRWDYKICGVLKRSEDDLVGREPQQVFARQVVHTFLGDGKEQTPSMVLVEVYCKRS